MSTPFSPDAPFVEPVVQWIECTSPVGRHRMAWTQWGNPRNSRVVVCVHGVSRTGRDFDVLARRLSARYRVLCPDIVGRGRSDWLPECAGASVHYAVPQYVADCMHWLDALGIDTVDWVGTSMGGLIGMGIAASAGKRIARLILNDVGPVINGGALARIGDYLGADISFATQEDGLAYLRQISTAFGPHSDQAWRDLNQHMLRQVQSDKGLVWRLHYDPRIGEGFRALAASNPTGADIALWDLYDAIRCPTLVVRGALSDLLSLDTAVAMTQRGPRADVREVPGVGHAPTLVSADQCMLIEDYLAAGR